MIGWLQRMPPMRPVERPFDCHEPGWLYQVKLDGHRLTAEFGAGRARLRTRNGADATRWFPEITRSLSSVRQAGPFLIDGEVCVFDEFGRSDARRLRERAQRRRWHEGAAPVTYCVFDLLVAQGKDLTASPLHERKAQLAGLLAEVHTHVVLLDFHEAGDAERLKQKAEDMKLSGFVAKRADSPYLPGVRSRDWVTVNWGRTEAHR